MNLFSAIAVAAFSAFAALLLKKHSPEIALLVSLSGAITAAVIVMEGVSQLLSGLGVVFLAEEKYLTIPIKALGVTLISTVSSKLCEDAGEKAMAFTVTLAGKTAVLITAIPLFYELTELLTRILKL